MAVPRTTLWAIQPHTKTKHLILKRYLEAWLPIMARYNGRIVFIDGFAGPGRYSGGEPGSPVIALRTLLEHSSFRAVKPQTEVSFVFIEAKADRAEALHDSLASFASERSLPAWVTYQVVDGEFASEISGILDQLDAEGAQIAPTFAFVDPFGYSGIPMKVIARLVSNPHCECLINFSFESVNRFLDYPDPQQERHFDELFGALAWRALRKEGDPDKRRNGIRELYRRCLLEAAKLRYVWSFEMVNEGNRTEYFLFFGTHSPAGLSKMKEAMWRADPETGRIFSDRSDPNQMLLLRLAAETELGPLLSKRFRGKPFVRIEEIEDFVLAETPYSEKIHLRRLTLRPLEKASPPRIDVRRPSGKRNRPGEYPSGTMVKFL